MCLPSASDNSEVSVVAHCLLNPLTRVRGLFALSFCPAGPAVQLPCPEALYLGLSRWAVTRDQMDVPQYRRFCRELLLPCADLLQMLAEDGAALRIIGIANSPSCGILTTSCGYRGGRVCEQAHEHVAGRGIFMEELLAELERRGLMFAVEEITKEGREKIED